MDSQKPSSIEEGETRVTPLTHYIAEHLFARHMGSDVVFVVPSQAIGNSSPPYPSRMPSEDEKSTPALEYITVPAHKIILSRSPVFRRWFFGENAHRFADQMRATGSVSYGDAQVSTGGDTIGNESESVSNAAAAAAAAAAAPTAPTITSTTTTTVATSEFAPTKQAMLHEGADAHVDTVRRAAKEPLLKREGHITQIQENISHNAFMEILRWLYTDTVQLDAITVIEVFHAARKYLLESLEEECLHFLKDFVTQENVFQLWDQARLFDRPDLEARCVSFIERNAEKLLVDHLNDFCELSWDDVLFIVQDDNFVVEECIIYEACLAWAERECQRKDLNPTPENKRHVLGDILTEIRFTNMDQKLFSTRVIEEGVLTKDEIIEVFSYWVLAEEARAPSIEFNTQQRRRHELSFLVIGSGQTNKDIDLVRTHVLQAINAGSVGDVVVETYNASNQTPLLEELRRFNGILVFSENRFAEADTLGDVLADYYDQCGGGVVVSTFSNCTNSLQLKGRIVEYLPVTMGAQKNLVSSTPHWATVAEGVTTDHPLLNGFRTLDCGKYRAKCELKEFGECVLRWEDNVPLVAYSLSHKGVVCLNFYPASSSVYTDCWSRETDGCTILLNSLLFVSNKE